MHPVNLITASITEKTLIPCEPKEELCCVTGQRGPCIPRKLGVLSSFTSQDVFAAPQSAWISVDAWQALKHRPERASSWYCDGREFRTLNRRAVRDMVLAGQYGDTWAAYATTSYKKHGSLWAIVNRSPRAVWRFEMLNVDCSDRVRLMEIWTRLNEELRAGFGRSLLETLDCPAFLLNKLGAARWLALEQWARPLIQSPLYRFLCYLLPSQEELKEGFDHAA